MLKLKYELFIVWIREQGVPTLLTDEYDHREKASMWESLRVVSVSSWASAWRAEPCKGEEKNYENGTNWRKTTKKKLLEAFPEHALPLTFSSHKC